MLMLYNTTLQLFLNQKYKNYNKIHPFCYLLLNKSNHHMFESYNYSFFKHVITEVHAE